MRQESPTNMQDGEPKGTVEPKIQTPATTPFQQNDQSVMVRASDDMQKGQNNDTGQNFSKGGLAKDLGFLASYSGSKSKNKPSKKRRDALKKKLESSMVNSESIETSSGNKSAHETEICKKFILIDEYAGMIVPPLSVHLNPPLGGELTEAVTNICHFNSDPMLPSNEEDKYGVINSEDEVDKDTLPLMSMMKMIGQVRSLSRLLVQQMMMLCRKK